MFNLSILLKLFLVLLYSLKGTGQLQDCSHIYVISVANGSFIHSKSSWRDSCLQSSPSLDIPVDPDCALLHHVLPGYNSVIVDGDCLELQFMPGEYWFSSLSQIQLSYSLVLTAPMGGVSIACNQTSHNTCNTGGKNKNSSGVSVKASFMMAVNGSQDRDVFVSINSLAFSNCSKRIQFNLLSNVTVTNSSFSGFSSSVLDFFNVNSTILKKCSFTSCTSCDLNPRYRSNAGAVSMAYYYNGTAQIEPKIEIVDCSFSNNKAYQFYTNQFDVFNSVISGRGGGLGIHTEGSQSNVHVNISRCEFTDNWAEVYGGGIWTIFSGENTFHVFILEDSTFINNGCGPIGNGGAVNVAVLLSDDKSRPVNMFVRNCNFEGNYANFGGGFSFLEVYRETRGNDLTVCNTNFTRNRATVAGAAIVLETFSYVQSRLGRYYYNFTNCIFQENDAVGGTFGTSFNSINFYGNIVFLNNSGPALRLVGALVKVHENMSFIGNVVSHHGDGGALFIQAFGQVMVKPGTSLSFVDNVGDIGAAIRVDVQRSSPVFLELLFNPQCFLLYENPRTSPKDWEDVSIKFAGNVARVGPAVYASHLNHCSWYTTITNNSSAVNSSKESIDPYRPVFEAQLFRNWTAFHVETTNVAKSQKGKTNDIKFYFQTEPFQLVSSVNKYQLAMYPGQTVPISLVARDLFNNPTILVARISDSRLGINSGAFNQAKGNNNEPVANKVVFDPSLLLVDPAMGTANLTYGVGSNDDDDADDISDVPIVIDTPFTVLHAAPFKFNLTLALCDPGYTLKNQNGSGIKMCLCSNENNLILNCKEDGGLILRDGTWAGPDTSTDRSLDITVCPMPYCSCKIKQSWFCDNIFTKDQTDEQCHLTRRGVLCGRCVNGTAVGVLRTNCRQCHGNAFYSVAVLVVGDLLVLAALLFAFMKLDFYFPYSLRGLLFYVQTVYYTTENFPSSFWDIRKYMLYVSSAVSLYFPFDFCLSPDTSTLSTFGLKLIPPAIAFMLCLAVAIGVHIDKSYSGSAGRRHVWQVLWFLLLLFYAPLLHTCIAILKCPILHTATGRKRWFYDGEVECYKDSHVIFSIIAILIMVPLVLLIPILFAFIATVNRRKKISSRTVERIFLALREGYRESGQGVQYYSVWELIRRLLLISIMVALPGRSVVSLYVVVSCLAVHMYCKPYKMAFQNILETLILLDYILLLLLRSNITVLDIANSGNYSGTMVPNTTEDGLPPLDNVAWLFIPPFYLPLVLATTLILVVFIYRILKYAKGIRRVKKVQYVRKDLLDISAAVTTISYPVPTTMVERPLSYSGSFK